jgi:ubiquinol-cytochrome c reductase core subunit 2
VVSAPEEKFTRLPNGFTVASVELGGAVSSLVLAYRAGSRYQQADEGGLVHLLRNNVGKDSEKYLGVKLLWQLGSIGGNLNSYITKDLLAIHTNVVSFKTTLCDIFLDS